MKKYDVIIIGGGLAGLTSAIHLAKFKRTVLVFEKYAYPKHKVCGEYVSNEVKPYLDFLDVQLDKLCLPQIDELHITTPSGKFINQKLPLGGFGISRYTFDKTLYEKATQLGVHFVFDKVKKVIRKADSYIVNSKSHSFLGDLVLGSFGKRSNLDVNMQRDFTTKPAAWVGIKAHYAYPNFPKNKVELHNFDGGYCGLSLVENHMVNFCYLAQYDSFKKYKNIEEFNNKVLASNPSLASFFERATLAFDQHLAIAQVSFEAKKTVENGMMMLGDSASLIHPLCGNGMAMAIHSAKLAAEEVLAYRAHQSKSLVFENYTKKWKTTFNRRMKYGRIFQKLLMHQNITNLGISLGSKMPFLVKKMIQQTHGKPILC